MNIAEALHSGRERLAGVIAEPVREVSLLLAAAIGRRREFMIAHPEYRLTGEEFSKFEAFIKRRAKREPLQYILGRQEFYGHEFIVGPGVLIPRPETENLVRIATESLSETDEPKILEIGIGSGCISIAVLKLLPAARIIGVDISPRAISYARLNAERLNVSPRLYLIQSDLFDAFADVKFDAILTNPPYVARDELSTLQPEVRDFEPQEALTDGGDGLSLIRQIVAAAPAYLRSGGGLFMEIGFGQSGRVGELFAADERWTGVTFEKDLSGIERTAVAFRK